MTNEELILKDLTARLPYNVKFPIIDWDDDIQEEVQVDATLYSINKDGYVRALESDYEFDITSIKPYLFPLSNMTDEMLEELNTNGFFKYRDSITNVSHLESNGKVSEEIYTYIDIETISFLMEFFYSHHIDFRGLIEKGLAIDATGLGIY